VDVACANCGAPNPTEARFCMRCGTPVGAPAQTQERRVVSILFVDLVGFTERSDQADPEDVRRTLVPYHARVKAVLERFGGTLDKFIGDAVMGVFGAPLAHEDDPVRAVNAARAILQEVAGLQERDPDLAVRVAVNTGEAVVSFGSGPQVGEAVAGDVVNTASRLQSIAPRNGIVVGETTARSVRAAFELAELPPARVKGKSEPLRVWRVLGPRAPSDVFEPSARFVGRQVELDEVLERFDEVVRTSTPGNVVIVGDAGIGKTRFVRELSDRLARSTSTPQWLSTRCQPYGEDVGLRPAARLVEAAVAIGVRADQEEIRSRLDSALAAGIPDQVERDGVRVLLERFVGSGETDGATSMRDLAHAIASVLSERPVVIAVEDVHWAEQTLLQLLIALRDEVRGRSVLFLATTRSADEPLGPSAATLELAPLAEAETETLVADLLGRSVFTDLTPERLAERAGGNPLYAVEFVRALADRPEAARASVPLPDTVQSVIAARLDVVPAELRAAVFDAAVIGPEFWVPAVAALDHDDREAAEASVKALATRGVVAAGSPAWFNALPTYRFTHALFREVAYARLPRATRADKHARAARWLVTESGEHAGERADAIAHHFEQAFLSARASGDEALQDAVRDPAAHWLNAAGRRVRHLDVRGAFDRHERSLAIAAPGSVEHAFALTAGAAMGGRAGLIDGTEALRRIDDAVAAFRTLGDLALLGWSLVRRYNQLAFMGRGVEGETSLDEAIELLESVPAGQDLAESYAYRSEGAMLAGRSEESLAWAERALSVAAEVRSDNAAIMALHLRGNARGELGDAGGLDDLRDALRRAEFAGSAADIVYSHMYLGEWSWLLEGPRAGLTHFDAARDLSERRRIMRQHIWSTAGSLGALFDAGRWDDLVERIEQLRNTDAELIDPTVVCVADIWGAKLSLARGDRALMPDAAELVERALGIDEMHVVVPGLSAAAMIAARDGDVAQAHAWLEHADDASSAISSPTYREEIVADATRTAIAVGAVVLAARFADGEGTTARSRATYATARAAVLEANRADDRAVAGAWGEAVAAWRSYGGEYERALALAGSAAALDGCGDLEGARGGREEAERIATGLGASTVFLGA
jgi:class 3 adenylate cyclase/tetratricopeptide (TPR) repeat protein